MKRTLLTMIFVATLIVTVSWAEAGTRPHPLYGNPIIGNSAEIVNLWPGSYDTDSCRIRIYDFDGATDSIMPKPTHHWTGTHDWQDLKMHDVTCGDFNGDGRDDIAAVYFTGDFGNMKLVIPQVNGGILDWSSAHETMLCCVNGWDPGYKVTNVRLISGNFDDDVQSEFVVAYWSFNDGYIHVDVYETNASLVPSRVAGTATQRMAHVLSDPERLRESSRFDVAAGDFNGDGKDEIILVSAEYVAASDWRLFARVYECDLSHGSIITRGGEYVHSWNPGSLSYGEGNFVDRLSVATGHLTGLIQEQAVVGWQRKDGWWEYDWWWGHRYWTWCSGHMAALRISNNLDTVTVGPVADHGGGNDRHTDWGPDKYNIYISGRPRCVATGDLNLDGKDEVLSQSRAEVRVFTCAASLVLDPTDARFGASDRFNDRCRTAVQVADLDLDPNTQVWRPEVVISDWAGTGGKRRIHVCEAVVDSAGTITSLSERAYIDEDTYLRGDVALAVGDFDGDGIRLGEPTFHRKEGINQPTVVINAPPVHFDVFDAVVYDVNTCFDSSATCGFRSVYTQSTSGTHQMATTVRSDWGVSAGLRARAQFMGFGVDAALTASYGENMSKTIGVTKEIYWDQTKTAKNEDWVLATTADYDIWEYPVSWDGPDRGSLLVVIPTAVQEEWIPTDQVWDKVAALPAHEVGNLLSYHYYPDPAQDNPDVLELLKYGPGYYINPNVTGDEWSLNIGEFVDSQYTREWNASLEVGVVVSGPGIAVGVGGHYGEGEVSTHRTTVGDQFGVSVEMESVDESIGEVNYTLTPYVYWSLAGALVLDYNVKPDTSDDPDEYTWWDTRYKSAPDLGMVMPRRYDSAKGAVFDYTRQYQTPEIVFDPVRPDPGDEITVIARIHNFSLRDNNTAFNVRFYLGDPDLGGEQIVSKSGDSVFTLGPALPARSDTTFSFQWDVPLTVPYRPRVYAVIDAEDSVTEVHENNNRAYNKLLVDGIPTSVEDDLPLGLPLAFELGQSYPNPFNAQTAIRYAVERPMHVNIAVYNLLGQTVRTLVDADVQPGEHTTQWDGRSESGSTVASGVYLYSIRAGGQIETKRMLLLK